MDLVIIRENTEGEYSHIEHEVHCTLQFVKSKQQCAIIILQ